MGPRGMRMGSREGSTMRKFIVFYRSPIIVRMIKSRKLMWAGHVARMEEGGSSFKTLTSKPIGNRSLGRPRRRLEDNIRMDLKVIGIEELD